MKAHLSHPLLARACREPLLAGQCCCGPALGAGGNVAGKCSQPHPAALSSRDLRMTLVSAGKGESHRGQGAAEGSRPDAKVYIFAVGSVELSEPQGQAPARTSHDPWPWCIEVCSQRQEM